MEESVSPSLSLGHHKEASQQLLAPGSPCLLAGSKHWEEEGGRERVREGVKQLVPNPTWMAGFWQAFWAFPPSNLPPSLLHFCS